MSPPEALRNSETSVLLPKQTFFEGKVNSNLSGLPSKVRKFYIAQNEHISNLNHIHSFLKHSFSKDSTNTLIADNNNIKSLPSCSGVVEATLEDGTLNSPAVSSTNSPTDAETLHGAHKLIINLCFIINLILFAIKVAASFATGSVSVLASCVDSLLDLLSGAVIFITMMARRAHSQYEYPVGKNRMEPLGIIVFSSVMATASLQIISEAVNRLTAPNADNNLSFDLLSAVILGSVIVTKLILWFICRSYTSSTSIQALAQDHRNDVGFNAFSTLFAFLASEFSQSWIDDGGAILLSLFVISTWTGTAIENIRNLTGRSATPQEHQLITYLVYDFHPLIQKIDTVRAYSAGNGLLIEVDIVLPPDTSLHLAHDIGESLQIYLESMPVLEVERAFVHLDYEWDHPIEHKKRLYLGRVL